MEAKRVVYKIAIITTLFVLSFFVEKATYSWRSQKTLPDVSKTIAKSKVLFS